MTAFTFPSSTQPTVAQQIQQMGSQALAQLANTRIRSYKLFWANPVQTASELGTTATAVFQSDAALVAFLGPQLLAANAPADVQAAATAGIPAKWAVAFNADGSVTITAVPPTP